MAVRTVITTAFVVFVILSGDSTQAQQAPPPAAVKAESSMAAVKRIEDITVEESLLKKEDFRPLGEKKTLSLQDAIDIALKKNPNMQIAQHSLWGSLAELDSTESDWRSKYSLDSSLDNTLRRRTSGSFRLDPVKGLIEDTKREYENDSLFDIGPRYTRKFKNGAELDINPKFAYEYYSDGSFDRGVTNLEGNHYEDRYSMNVSYNLPLNSRPREQIRTQLENAKLSTIQSDYQLFSQGKTTEESVINRYWNIKQLQERVVIQKQRLVQSRQVAFVIETQYQYENAAKQKVGEAQTDVLNNEADLIDLEGSLRNAMESLNIFLGIPIETELDLTDPLEITPLPMTGKDYVSRVTETNLDLKSQRLAIRKTENSLRVTKLGQQPDVILSTFANGEDEGSQNLGAGLTFSWPFGDGGATRARVRALEENLEQAKIRLWDAERQLVQSTYNDLRELQLQQQRIDILMRNVKQTETNLDTGLINFKEFGQITFRDLQDLQIDVANAQSTLVQAKALYNAAKSSLLSKIHDYQPTDEVAPILKILN